MTDSFISSYPFSEQKLIESGGEWIPSWYAEIHDVHLILKRFACASKPQSYLSKTRFHGASNQVALLNLSWADTCILGRCVSCSSHGPGDNIRSKTPRAGWSDRCQRCHLHTALAPALVPLPRPNSSHHEPVRLSSHRGRTPWRSCRTRQGPASSKQIDESSLRQWLQPTGCDGCCPL